MASPDLPKLRAAEAICRSTLRWLVAQLATATGDTATLEYLVADARRSHARAAAQIGAELRWPGAYQRRLERLRNGLLTYPETSSPVTMAA